MTLEGDTIEIRDEDGAAVTVPRYARVGDLEDRFAPANGHPPLGAMVNHDVVSLNYRLEVDSTVRFLTIADHHGYQIFRRTLLFLLAKAVRENFPGARLVVEHSLGPGIFCSFECEGCEVDAETVATLEKAVREIMASGEVIEHLEVGFLQALRHLEDAGQTDKVNLLRFRNPPKIAMHVCGEFRDLAHGVLARHPDRLGRFALRTHPPGFLVEFPTRESPDALTEIRELDEHFRIFQEHRNWARVLGIRTVGDLNQTVADGRFPEIVGIMEAFHDKKLGHLADAICDRPEPPRWILIAGPSSAGKTTFAHKLMIHLKVNGLQPVTISVDDYFFDREHTPRDEEGAYDFEHLEALDLDLLNDHLSRLDRGEAVETPRFDFTKGVREFRGDLMKVEEGQVVILEGIHALNPKMTHAIPEDHKTRVYISPLTQLNLDFNNRIATTDLRILRRMLRDHKHRGHSALDTLRMWPSLRRGEKRWIFPFQHQADYTYNSALIYELAVLRPLVEPVLAEVKPDCEEYAEARRLMEFLKVFVGAPVDVVPPTSVLWEFVGPG